MPDPIEAPYLNWDTPNPADRIFETNASRSAKDKEEFLAELKRRQEKHHNDEDKPDEQKQDEQKQDTFEPSYSLKESAQQIHKASKEEDKDSPGQVVDFKA